MKTLETLLKWTRIFLGGKEYQKSLQRDIRHHFFMKKPIPSLNYLDLEVIQEHDAQYKKLQTLHMITYGNYFTDNDITKERLWI